MSAVIDSGAAVRANGCAARARATSSPGDGDGGGRAGGLCCARCLFCFGGVVQAERNPGRLSRSRIEYERGLICQLRGPVAGRPPARTEADRVCSGFTDRTTLARPLLFHAGELSPEAGEVAS